MPTYEYRCPDCEHNFEEFQSISAPPITVCPECSGETKRVISGGAGFLFKGSGFYITENRSKEYKKAESSDKSSSITTSSSTKKESSKNSDKSPTKKPDSK